MHIVILILSRGHDDIVMESSVTANCDGNAWFTCVDTIYSIICLKSVDVRTMQFVILAHSPREMSQTDRIHPRYFLLRVRVSIRPRYFVNAKKP